MEGKPFYVHEHLVALHSKPLAKLMHSETLEGKQSFATLEDVDQATFGRFIEWLYREYYHAAMPTQLTSPNQPSADNIFAKPPVIPTGGFGFDIPKHDAQSPQALQLLRTLSVPAPSSGEPSNQTSTFGPAGEVRGAVDLPVPVESPAAFTGRNPTKNEVSGSVFGRRTSSEKKESAQTPKADPSTYKSIFRSPGQDAKELFNQRKYVIRQTAKNLPQPRWNKDKYKTIARFSFVTPVFICSLRSMMYSH